MYKHLIFLILVFILIPPAVKAAGTVGEIVIYHAGSLEKPLARIENQFETEYPGLDVVRRFGGSTAMARLISQQGHKPDIMISADYTVINNQLIDRFAAWNILFASNEMVLAYTDESRFGKVIDSHNWYDVLQRPQAVWSHSDPHKDPCGYRSLMVMQLAEKFYQKTGLYRKLLESRQDKLISPGSAGLVNMLLSGKLDYAWEYLSVAVQNNLSYISLNDRINLGNYLYNDFYNLAEVKLQGTDNGPPELKRGRSITYGATVLRDAPNPEGAVTFLAYFLNPDKGLRILEDMGQPPLIPCRVKSEGMKKSLPQALQPLVQAGDQPGK